MTDAAAFWRLRIFESLGSTSDLCRSLAEAGEKQGLAVLARTQTTGRGSRGREWLSEPGNLFLSLLLRPQGSPREAGMWALLAGVAVAESLDRADIALKWPNDILLNGDKLGGILIDSAVGPDEGIDWMVIGIGLNLSSAPRIAGRAIAMLADGSVAEDVGRRIMARVDHWRKICLRDGWASLRAAWLAYALPVGTEMSMRHGTQTIGGRFAGLSDDGGLMLQTDGRIQAFSSGEIWLPADAAAKQTGTPSPC